MSTSTRIGPDSHWTVCCVNWSTWSAAPPHAFCPTNDMADMAASHRLGAERVVFVIADTPRSWHRDTLLSGSGAGFGYEFESTSLAHADTCDNWHWPELEPQPEPEPDPDPSPYAKGAQQPVVMTVIGRRRLEKSVSLLPMMSYWFGSKPKSKPVQFTPLFDLFQAAHLRATADGDNAREANGGLHASHLEARPNALPATHLQWTDVHQVISWFF